MAANIGEECGWGEEVSDMSAYLCVSVRDCTRACFNSSCFECKLNSCLVQTLCSSPLPPPSPPSPSPFPRLARARTCVCVCMCVALPALSQWVCARVFMLLRVLAALALVFIIYFLC